MNTPAASPSNNTGKRRVVLGVVSLIFVAIGIGAFLWWFLVLSQRESTDDAYVSGNLVSISSQQAGTVIAVMADDTQRVQAGQVLIRLDPTDAQVMLDQAAAALAQSVRQIRQQDATTGQLDAAIHSRELELSQAQADLARREPLAQARAIAPEELKHAQVTVDVAKAAVVAAQRQAAAARALIENTQLEQQPAVLQAKAAYEQAWVARARCTLLAPVGGEIAQRSAQIGARVSAGQGLMTVVPLQQVWIDANFKEGQLRHLRMGQPAEIRTDVYGGDVVLHGRLAGVSAGTGSAFSLLPAQNASGNWIKVVQRVPVRIRLDEQELQRYPLRIGLSADVRVSIVDQSGPVLSALAGATPIADTDVYARAYDEARAQADSIISANVTRKP